MKKKYIDFVLYRPKLVLFLLALATLGAVALVVHFGVEFASSTENMFPQKNPKVAMFRQFQKRFGNDEFLVVVVHTPGQSVFSPGVFGYLERLDKNLGQVDHIDSVLSLASLKQPEIQRKINQAGPGEELVYLLGLLTEEERQKALAKWLSLRGTEKTTNLVILESLSPPTRKKITTALAAQMMAKTGTNSPLTGRDIAAIVWKNTSPSERVGVINRWWQDREKSLNSNQIWAAFPGKRRLELRQKMVQYSLSRGLFEVAFTPWVTSDRNKTLAEFRRAVLKIPSLRGQLLPREGEDKTSLVLQVRRPQGAAKQQVLAKMMGEVEKAVEGTSPPPGEYEYFLAGSPAVKAKIFRSIQRDLAIFFPITLAIIFLVTWFLFRTWSSVILTISVIVITVIWILAIMAVAGSPITTMTSLVLTLMLVIGVADVVHLLAKYFHRWEQTEDRVEATRQMLDQLILPCWITSFTTSVGFFSLAVSDMKAIARFGVFAGVGTLLAFVLSVIIVPAATVAFPIYRKGRESRPGHGLTPLLHLFYRTSLKSKRTLALAFVIASSFAGGMYFLQVETNFILFFRQSSPLRQANQFVEQEFAGIYPMEIAFRVDRGSVFTPKNLAQIDALQRYLEQEMEWSDEVDQTTSIVDFLKLIYMVRWDDWSRSVGKNGKSRLQAGYLDPEKYEIPPSSQLPPDEILPLLDKTGGWFRQFVAPNLQGDYLPLNQWKLARISLRLRSIGSQKAAKIIKHLEEYGRERLDKGTHIEVTGTGALFPIAANSVVSGQKKSFLLALAIIFAVLVIVFRSFVIGTLGLIPILFPIVITFGAMGWIGIPLNSWTSMVASISIGIAVDVAVHFISRFQREYEPDRPLDKVILVTFQTTGRPLVFTTGILVAGFMVLGLATFIPTVQFGLLTCIALAGSLLAGLVILPAAIYVFPWKREGKG